MSDSTSLPDDLVQIQRDVYLAQMAIAATADAEERERLREAERAALLALHRHPARAGASWTALRQAALGED